MTDAPNWDLYRTFLAVLEERSLSSAARALGLTQPTVGRHIDALEQGLSVELFVRSPNGLAPTEAAIELRPHAEVLAAAAAALLRSVTTRDGAMRGTVRIAASDMIGAEVLPPILADLGQDHPELAIELALSNDVADLLRRDADIAVRMVEPGQKALVVKRIGAIKVGLHAHRRYLKRHGTPASLDELMGHALIGFDRETAVVRSMQQRLPALRRSLFRLRTDSDLAQLAAIRAGYGIGACQVALARRDRNLVPVLPRLFELDLPTAVVMHEDLRGNRSCRTVFDALVAGLQAYLREQQASVAPMKSATLRS
jgi:DNA-binding transcriptional LysR family regulator